MSRGPAALTALRSLQMALGTIPMDMAHGVARDGTTLGPIRLAFVDSAGINGGGPVITLAFTARSANDASSRADLVSRGIDNPDPVDVPVTTRAAPSPSAAERAPRCRP